MPLKPAVATTLIVLLASLSACNGSKQQTTEPDLSSQASPTAPLTQSPSPSKIKTSEVPAQPGSKSTGSGNDAQLPSSISKGDKPSGSDSSKAIDPPSKPNSSANSEKPDQPGVALNPPNPLPTEDGVTLGNIEYRSSETTADPALEQAILQELPDYREVTTTPDQQVRYYYNRIDLSGDGNPEVLAYLVGSYTCGSGGCTLLVFQPTGQDYQLVSRMTLVNTPVVVSPETNAGWKDLVLYVAGGGASSRYVEMEFDGNSYPSNPSVAPDVPLDTTIDGTAILVDDPSTGGGIRLAP